MIYHLVLMSAALLQPVPADAAPSLDEYRDFSECHGMVDGLYSNLIRARSGSSVATGPEDIEAEAEMAQLVFLIADINRAIQTDEEAEWLDLRDQAIYEKARADMEKKQFPAATSGEFAEQELRAIGRQCENVVNRLGQKYIPDFKERI